ncbi:MAG: tetratricopeptide repeat protein [Acidobacteriota bacterium]
MHFPRTMADEPKSSSNERRPDASERPTVIAGGISPARSFGTPTRIGPYVVEGELGRGGMGVVWRGRDERLDRPVALKTVTELFSGERGRRRFLQEARLLARLNHPHVATVHDLPFHEERPVLVMELLDGESLSSRLERGPLSVPDTLRLGEQVASALALAHEHDIVHRDLKPANIQVLSSGDVKVLDFGLARTWTTDVDAGEARVIAGTPGYMSPEQAMGLDLDGRSDLFAFGAVLHECLTGHPCFAGERRERTRAVLEDEPRWSDLPDDLPAGLLGTMRACLSREPDGRPGNALAVRDLFRVELRRLTQGQEPVPPPSSGRRVRPVLPAQTDEFVGRTEELAQLEGLLSDGARLISLLGPGGAGKTRLATHHAWQNRESFAGGAWFCDLSEVSDLTGLCLALARILDVPLRGGDHVEQLGHVIASRGSCLFVLDNFEQLVEHASAVGRWLERAPEARLVVTSRVLLGLSGEKTVQVGALPIEVDGVALFERRARDRQGDFAVTDENRSAVEEVVRLVDGLPLGIELAAARVRMLSPAELVSRMGDRFRLLAGGRGGPQRQATLEAAIDWSWELLAPWERVALAQLSVFAGEFRLDAAESVLDLSSLEDAPWPLDAVQALADKSLLRASTRPSLDPRHETQEHCFALYLSVRDYAEKKLVTEAALPEGESGEEAARRVHVRHGRHFASLGTEEALERRDGLGGPGRRSLERELDELVVACRGAVTRGDGEIAVDALAAAVAVLQRSGPYELATRLATEVVALDASSPKQRARALRFLGVACRDEGRFDEAREHLERALALAREDGDRPAEALALDRLGTLASREGGLAEAREHHDEALALERSLGDRHQEAVVLLNLGTVDFEQGRMEEARACFEASLALQREVGIRSLEGTALGNIGSVDLQQGRLSEARAHWEQALVSHHELGERRLRGLTLINLASLHLELGESDEAGACLEQALPIHREMGDRRAEGMVLGHLGIVDQRHGRDRALERYESALAIHREVGNRGFEASVLASLGSLHHSKGDLDGAIAFFEQSLAVYRDFGDRRFEGIVLGDLGELRWEQGRVDEARVDFEQGETVLRELDDLAGLMQVLCARGRQEARSGERDVARACWEEAERLARRLEVDADSPLGEALATLRKELADDGST